MIRSFRDLHVWQKSIDLSVAVYRLTKSFPKEETYGLVTQMRRAAISVASNIAEGHGRLTTGEFRQFLGIARGSNHELQTHLEIVRAVELGIAEEIEQAERISVEVGKMLSGLLEKLHSDHAAHATQP